MKLFIVCKYLRNYYRHRLEIKLLGLLEDSTDFREEEN